MVVKSGAGVGIPGGAHKPRVCRRTSDSPSSWSSVKIVIHDCWPVSLTLKSTSALIKKSSGPAFLLETLLYLIRIKYALSLILDVPYTQLLATSF